MQVNISKKSVGILVAAFVAMGLVTTLVGIFQDEDATEQVENKKKHDGHFRQRDKDRVEGVGEDSIDAAKGYNVSEALETDPYEELQSLIGLESVKEEVRTLANFAKVQKMRADKGLKNPNMSYHLVFTGSPGTGKTTVARIVARIYKDLGILKKGHLVETDRSGMIGQYVGQTAPKVNAMCDSALNGVLFIDEAYALTQKSGGQDYGDEAVATLLKRMEDDRDKLVVIVAGYTDEMKHFINTNPGLQSRFNRYINFPDYTPEELYKIFRMYLNKNEYTITKEAASYVQQRLDYVVAHKDRNFGNARYVRNVFEKAIQCQANRISAGRNLSEDQLTEITLADVKKAF